MPVLGPKSPAVNPCPEFTAEVLSPKPLPVVDPRVSTSIFRCNQTPKTAQRSPGRPTYVRLMFCILIACVGTGAATSVAHAQSRTAVSDSVDAQRAIPLAIARLGASIELDGVVNEAAWDAVQPLPLALHSPTYLGPLTERTDVRIAHDDRYLYIGGRMYDSDPAKIRTNTFYRDVYSGDDLLAVVIDSYNDYETAVWFVTNPAGARIDRTVSNDAVGEAAMNYDWNAHWDVATSQNEEGWFAEFRIPFSTLGFQVVNGVVEMGLIVYRYIPRKNERQTFPPLDPKWGGIAFAKPSQAQRVVLRGVRQARPVYITPYVLGGIRRVPTLSGTATAWSTDSDPTAELGSTCVTRRRRAWRWTSPSTPTSLRSKPTISRSTSRAFPSSFRRSDSSFRSGRPRSSSTPAPSPTACSTVAGSAWMAVGSCGSTEALVRWAGSAGWITAR